MFLTLSLLFSKYTSMLKLIPLLTLAPLFLSALSYEVEFVGICDNVALLALRDASQLVHLQDRPPPSVNGLRYRISSDLPALIDVLHAFAYYEATINPEIKNEGENYIVALFVDTGPQYCLSSYEVFQMTGCKEKAMIPECPDAFSVEDLGLKIGNPALSVDIVNAELQVLSTLARCGHPLAAVERRRIEVDMEAKKVDAAACVDEGPVAKFGPMTFYGLKGVDPRFIERRIAWKEGDLYNADLLEETQQRLLKSDLFSSVLISHGEQLDSLGELPMKMRLSEVKHKQFSVGVFYATVDGFGGSLRWIDRNIRGMGETLSVEGDFSKRWISGLVVYKKPDFLRYNQSYRALAQLMRENIRPTYLAYTYRFANYIEKKIGEKNAMSGGLKLEHITVTKSADDNTYLLLGLPLFGKYSTADNELDPTQGLSIVYQCTPYQSLDYGKQHFIKQRLTTTFYLPMTTNKKVIFACRVQFGSIAGAKRTAIPLPKMFLGGSDDDLRGYRYKTVSPINSSNQPLGGRSAVFATVETRIRITKSLGFVPFADFATITLSEAPQLNAKWFKSVGAGIRYFAFFGPLRFDVGFPLDRRKGIDPSFMVYAAVGQAF